MDEGMYLLPTSAMKEKSRGIVVYSVIAEAFSRLEASSEAMCDINRKTNSSPS